MSELNNIARHILDSGVLNSPPHFRIIPDEDVPAGYRRMDGMDIYINPGNYRYIREMDAKAIFVASGFLKELPGVIRESYSKAMQFKAAMQQLERSAGHSLDELRTIEQGLLDLANEETNEQTN